MNGVGKIQKYYDAGLPERRVRYLRFIKLWHPGSWILKIYLHSASSDQMPSGFLLNAKRFIRPQLVEAERTGLSHRVGFLILADGVVISNWIMLNWWSSFHLYQRIFSVDRERPHRITDAPTDLVQCVYDLRITAFESEAWRTYVVENPKRDVQTYLKSQLNADV
jgi:hypothetical protein